MNTTNPAHRAETGEVSVRFEQAAASALSQFQTAVAALLEAAPGEARRAADVERAFGIDTKLAWQMHRIARAPNPLASATNLPAAVSVKRLLKAATRKQLPVEVIDQVAASFDLVERLVSEHAGDRDRFMSMVGPLLKDEAEVLDLKHKKAAYRAMSHLVGLDERTHAYCSLIHPGSEPGHLDFALIGNYVKLHRLRSTASLIVPLGNARSGENAPGSLASIAGDGEYLLRAFCSRGVQVRDIVALTGGPRGLEIADAIGRNNSVDIVSASVARGGISPYVSPGEPRLTFSSRVNVPTETLIADKLIHRDALPVRHPLNCHVGVFADERVTTTSPSTGMIEQWSRLSVNERCEYFGMGVEALATPDVPRYVEIIRHVCGVLGWNVDDFHVYRCRIAYPIFKAVVRVRFDLPPLQHAAAAGL